MLPKLVEIGLEPCDVGISPFKVSAKPGCDLLQARQLCCGGLRLRIRVVGLRGALSPLFGLRALVGQALGENTGVGLNLVQLGLDRSAVLHFVGTGLFTGCERGADSVQLARRGGERGFHLGLRGGATGQLSLTCGKAGPELLELRLQRLPGGCALRQLGVSPFQVSAKLGCDLLQARQLCCGGLRLRIRVVGLRGALSPLLGLLRESLRFGARLLEHALRPVVGRALLVKPGGGKRELLTELFELGIGARRLGLAILTVGRLEHPDLSGQTVDELQTRITPWLRLGRQGCIGPTTTSRMAPLDLRPQAGTEAFLLLHVQAELLGQHRGESRSGDIALHHEDLAEPLAVHLLVGERLVQLLSRDQALLDEELSEQLGGYGCRFHVRANRHTSPVA